MSLNYKAGSEGRSSARGESSADVSGMRPVAPGGGFDHDEYGGFSRGRRLRLKSIARFTRQMSTYQDSYVDVRKALTSMSNGFSDRRARESLIRVRDRINGGATLYQAFSREGNAYPPIFLQMTKIGEDSGTLALVYKQLAIYLEQQVAMRRRFVARLIYPCFMVAALVLVHSLLTAVLTTLGAGSGGWPEMEALFVRTLIKDVSMVGAIVAGILLLRHFLVGKKFTDAFILHVPGLAGPFRKLMLSRFSLSMYLMTGSAIGYPDAVSESGKATGNSYVAGVLDRVGPLIMEGTPLAPALDDTGLFPPDFIEMIQVAEESGSVSESFQRMSVHYSEEAEIALNRLVSALSWGIYMTVVCIMAYYVISLYAKYVNSIMDSMSG